MLLSLAYIFIISIVLSNMLYYIKIPKIIGMLITGIIIGPHILNLLDNNMYLIFSDIRKIALIVILLKAGITLNIQDLKKIGFRAILFSFVPALFEILAYTIFAPLLFNITYLESALLGSVLSAVSPAVIVPRMVKLIENNYGTKNSVPQLILTGASCDDVFVIVLFSTFLSMVSGNKVNIMEFLIIPFNIIFGILLGIIVAYIICYIFNKIKIVTVIQILILLSISFILLTLEKKYHFSALLSIMTMGIVIKYKNEYNNTMNLSKSIFDFWVVAEILLFVLVGASVDIRYAISAGFYAVLLIIITLIVRLLGVYVCTIGSKLSYKERIFCMISYIPKATVQAAIGSVALSMGLPVGNLILSVAVISILITAPLGAFLIDNTYKRLIK